MRRFVLNSLIFFSPFLLLFGAMLFLDPFKVFWDKGNYYDEHHFVTLNREVVITNTYLKHYEREQFDAFIFGSSRAFALSFDEWKKHLPSEASPFLFNAFGEGIYGVRNKVVFIDEHNQTIRHALLVVDGSLLSSIKRYSTNPIVVSPPTLPNTSAVDFYLSHFNYMKHGTFIVGYIDYSIFRKHRSYMGPFINMHKTPNKYDSINGELVVQGVEEAIKEDSLAYYQRIAPTFYERASEALYGHIVTPEEVGFLKEIKLIFEKHQTDCKVIINPTYDQIPLNEAQVALLEATFGKENVFDFSGKNKYTENMGDYFDAKHYRKHIGTALLKDVYQ